MYLFFCLTHWTSLYSTYTNVDCVDDPVKVHNVIGMNDTLCTTIVIEASLSNWIDSEQECFTRIKLRF